MTKPGRSYNVAIVGAGNIGSRHLQGLAPSLLPLEVVVIDPSLEALSQAESRLREVKSHGLSARFSPGMDALPPSIDLCIVATTSRHRRGCVEEVLKRAKVRAFLLEKVAFDTVSDFRSVQKRLSRLKIPAWINCPVRGYPVFSEFRDARVRGPVSVAVRGGRVGLACNIVHYIDLVSALTGEKVSRVDASSITAAHESRRAGYWDFSGTAVAAFERGSELMMSSREDDRPIVVEVSSKEAWLALDMATGDLVAARARDRWRWKTARMPVPKQSSLTHAIARSILLTGHCDLPTIADSASAHELILDAFGRRLARLNGKNYVGRCPIT